MSQTHPRASVIIPHWNGVQHLEVCLNALRRQTFTDHEVILVDNGSTDGSQEYVRKAFPEVRLIELSENRGFTGACNAGYDMSRGEFVCLLNNDTEADPGWLGAIIDAFDRHPQVGIVASKMMLFDQRDRFHTAGDYYRVDGIPGNRGIWQRDEGQYNHQEPVFSACGGAAAYRRAMLQEIGFLDDAFFFSCEDVDLAWRAQLAGWEVLYVPDAIVYHKLKASDAGGTTSSYYDGRNFLYIIWKNYPTSLLRTHAADILRAQWRITRDALRAWRGAAARAKLRGQLAGLFGFFRMLPARKRIQATRQVDDRTIESRLTRVDEVP
ncbi:MAG: glycosyltransferase family 2 protein [Anaerolineae bacterium]|nr:glycosyltransferase family 2 protein [Promineifilum sp.]MCZ2114372.1 glycosyltransferase family 2 protein [Anaerolineae bacterium]